MIRLTSTSFTDIKKDIESFIERNKDKFPVQDSYPASAQNQIVELIAGWGAYQEYKHIKQRNETSMLNALLESSIYDKALELGYNIRRATSPSLVLKSVSTSTISLSKYQVLGSIAVSGEQFDLVYWGRNRDVSLNDEVVVHVGKVRVLEGDFTKFDFNETVVLQPNQSKGLLVDNFLTEFTVNDSKQLFSRNQEEFLTLSSAIDVTYWNEQAIKPGLSVWVSNPVHNYGLDVEKTDKYRLVFFETLGHVPAIKDYVLDAQFHPDFVAHKVASEGSSGDSLDFIRRIALQYGTTVNRAVSRTDWEIILKTHPLIEDAKFLCQDRECCGVILSYVTNDDGALTQTELTSVAEYMEPKKLAGVPYRLIKADPVDLHFLVMVEYDCGAKPIDDVGGVYEARIRDRVDEVFQSPSRVIGKSFDIRSLVAQVGRIGFQEVSIVSGVKVALFDASNSSVVPVANEDVFDITTKEYFRIKTTVELSCTPSNAQSLTASCEANPCASLNAPAPSPDPEGQG